MAATSADLNALLRGTHDVTSSRPVAAAHFPSKNDTKKTLNRSPKEPANFRTSPTKDRDGRMTFTNTNLRKPLFLLRIFQQQQSLRATIQCTGKKSLNPTRDRGPNTKDTSEPAARRSVSACGPGQPASDSVRLELCCCLLSLHSVQRNLI